MRPARESGVERGSEIRDAALTAAQQYLEKAAGDDDPERYQQFETALERARTRVAVSQRKRQ